MEIKLKAEVGQEVFYISDKGKIMSNKVESINVAVGNSSYRTDTWLGSAKTGVQVITTYKLENVPAGYILLESSIYTSKEELLSGL